MKWIPVSERLPKKDYKKVLVCFRHDDIVVGYIEDGEWYETNFDEKLNQDNITAWQPLPEPYKED